MCNVAIKLAMINLSLLYFKHSYITRARTSVVLQSTSSTAEIFTRTLIPTAKCTTINKPRCTFGNILFDVDNDVNDENDDDDVYFYCT